MGDDGTRVVVDHRKLFVSEVVEASVFVLLRVVVYSGGPLLRLGLYGPDHLLGALAMELLRVFVCYGVWLEL